MIRRWSELLDEGCPEYRATLIREIHSIFEVKLSGETIRQIINRMKNEKSPVSEDIEPPADPGSDPIIPFLEETTCSPPTLSTTDELPENPAQPSSQATSSEIPPPPVAPPASKSSPPSSNHLTIDAQLCDHLGMLIFANALTTITQATSPPEPLLAQWLGSVLLGARNIEQTKYLNWQDLSTLLGQTVRFPTTQRDQLTRLASPASPASIDAIDAVLRWNYQQLNLPDQDRDLYYDPHTAHYTGTQNILKGWCASIRWADKLINSDYIHTAQGHPIYFECTDNFDDLRARFFPLIGRLRHSLEWGPQPILTFIVDRGIYSNAVFNQVLADPYIHLITWEKGYQADQDIPWKTLVVQHTQAGTHSAHLFNRRRNNSRDQRPYHFEYIHRPWAKNPALRQIIVRATNPSGRTVQLSILAADSARRDQTQRQQRLIELTRLHNATKRHQKYHLERTLRIEAIHQQILTNDQAKSLLAKEVSRIDQLFAPFKTAYDNYRDDHDHFRKLTQSNGVLRWAGDALEVHLVPQVNYPPKLWKIITAQLAQLTTSGLTLPDGSGRPLRLLLTRKEQISVSITDIPEA